MLEAWGEGLFLEASVGARPPERMRDNMSLEADEAGGRLSGRRLPTSLPSSSQLNSRSLSRHG